MADPIVKYQLKLPPDYKAPPRPVRQFILLRSKLCRFLVQRWSSNSLPVKTAEIQQVLGLSGKAWVKQRPDIEHWISVAGWRKCSRKLDKARPARIGYWPPLRPVPRIDEWSEHDIA